MLFYSIAVVKHKRAIEKQHITALKIYELPQEVGMDIPDIRQGNLGIAADQQRGNA